MKFFNNIEKHFGKQKLTLLKEYSKQVNNMSKLLPSKIFLLKCRKYSLTPKFIINSTKECTNTIKQNMLNCDELYDTVSMFQNKLLNIIIADKCKLIYRTNNKIFSLQEKILEIFPPYVSDSFLTMQKQYYDRQLQIHKTTHIKKFEHLHSRFLKSLNIKVGENDFVNLVNIDVPNEIQWLLSLGPSFALPHRATEFPLFKIITDSEEAIKPIRDHKVKEVARAKIAGIISQYKHIQYKHYHNAVNLTLLRIHNNAKKFLKEHTDIILVNSDKGKSVVLMYKQQYYEKVNSMLSDTSTYKILQSDPTGSLQTKNNKIINNLFTNKIISKYEKYAFMTYNTTSPKLYALPKIHKTDIPMRPVVAFITTVSSHMSKLLSNILKSLTCDNFYTLKNSFELKYKLTDIVINSTEMMVSFDIISLFTNIPVQLAIDIINEKWDTIKTTTNMTKTMFFEILRFCLIDANYFLFNNVFYRQIFGMPMGNPLSSIIADIVTNRLIEVSLSKINYNPKIFVKYVDDFFAIIPITLIDTFLETLNMFHYKLQFTIEKEKFKSINYLDMTIIRSDSGFIETNWYRKNISSDRFLNYFSNHPLFMKMNTARSFVNRVLSLSSPVYHKNNIITIRNILKLNNYPNNIINKLIFSYRDNNNKIDNNIIPQTRFYKSITYVNGVSEKLAKVVTEFSGNTQLAYKPHKRLRNTFTKLKDPIPLLKRNNVIYKIPCRGNVNTGEECNMSYVGQTKQHLVKRLQGHKRDLIKSIDPSVPKTALMDHYQQLNHSPDFNSVSILATEQNYAKRLTIEALHIYTQRTYNIKRDTDDIAPVFCNVIDEHHTYKGRKRVFTQQLTPTNMTLRNINCTNTDIPSIKRRRIN